MMKKQRIRFTVSSTREDGAESATNTGSPGGPAIESEPATATATEAKAGEPGQVGDVCQIAFYERDRNYEPQKPPRFWTDWKRVGTRFFRCIHRTIEKPLAAPDYITCKIVPISVRPGEEDTTWYISAYATAPYSERQFGGLFTGSSTRAELESEGGGSPSASPFAEEFECWHPASTLIKITLQQLDACLPDTLPWPILRIILGYTGVDTQDVGRPQTRFPFDF